MRVARSSSASPHPCAIAAGAQARGPSGAAWSAAVAGSDSRGHGPPSSTTPARGRSSRPGRSGGVAILPRSWPRSSRRSSLARESTPSPSCPAIGSDLGRAATCRRNGSLGRSPSSGACPSSTLSSGSVLLLARHGSRVPREGRMCGTRSSPSRARRPRPSCSSTTSTPRVPPSRRVPARSGGREQVRSRSCALLGPCDSVCSNRDEEA